MISLKDAYLKYSKEKPNIRIDGITEFETIYVVFPEGATIGCDVIDKNIGNIERSDIGDSRIDFKAKCRVYSKEELDRLIQD